MPKVYKVPEAAEALNVSTRTVYEYIYQGRLRAAKIGNKWAIRPAWLDAFIESCVVTMAAADKGETP